MVSPKARFGEEVSFLCSDIALASSKPTIQWFRHKGNVTETITASSKYTIITTNDGHTSQLVIHEADSDAKFRCEFINAKGKDEKYFSLDVYGFNKRTIIIFTVTIIIVLVAVITAIRFVFVKSINRQKVYSEIKILL